MFGKFHKRKCDLSGESIISIFPANARFPVYKTTHWYSDSWEPPYQEYDPARPFFDQLYELQTKSPKPHQYGTQNQNSDYSDDVWECKNCYLCRSMLRSENVYYSYRTFNGHDSLDLCYCYDSDKSYSSNYCFKIFNTKYAFDSRDAMDSAFLYDCRDVKDCFMCWNLRHKQYCILNEQYSKEDYFRKIVEYNTGSWNELQKMKEEFAKRVREEAIHKTNYNVRVYDSSGNFMTDCKNCDNSYFLESSENCFDVYRGLESKETADSNGVWQAQMCWGVMQLSRGYRLFNSLYCTDCNDSEYLDFCTNCENCFGCVGLRNKKYCILNKQYEEKEYFKLRDKIASDMKLGGEYGQSFPMKMAYTGYNLSLAGTIFPAGKEEVERWGGYWEELAESQPADRELARGLWPPAWLAWPHRRPAGSPRAERGLADRRRL